LKLLPNIYPPYKMRHNAWARCCKFLLRFILGLNLSQ
jgi:hypothetical protein